jgi:uncharacterized protein UPF0150
MITAYITAALRTASYEIRAQAKNLEDCREELREVLEDWIVLGLQRGHSMPVARHCTGTN